MNKDHAPEPCDEPRPMDKKEGSLIPWFLAIVVGGGLAVSTMVPTHTMGATRSARIRWEAQKAQVQQTFDREHR